MSKVLQNEQEFAKQTRQGRVLQKGNSICKDTSVLTPFSGDPDSTGSSPKFKALFNKQAKCKPNHNVYLLVWVCVLLRTVALDANTQ